MDYEAKGLSSMPSFHITHKKNSKDLFNVPIIGNKPISETSIPKSFLSVSDRINFIDTPGHMSSEGEITEIRDSYANAKVFSQGKSIRLIIVIAYS